MTYKDTEKTTIAKRLHNAETSNKARFIALRDEIEEALQAGFTAKAIWQLLVDESKLDMSYRTFARYVNKHIHANDVPQASTEKKKTEKEKESEDKYSTRKTFVHNPVANPDELY